MFGCGPDETAYTRMLLQRSSVVDAITMIQPQLTSYSMEGSEPALLDVLSVLPGAVGAAQYAQQALSK